METVGLLVRIGLSLACVLGLVWLFSKGALRSGLAGRAGQRGQVGLLARQTLTRGTSVAVVQVGERALVLGVTEQQVTLLTEAAVEDVLAPVADEREDVTGEIHHAAGGPDAAPVDGDPATGGGPGAAIDVTDTAGPVPARAPVTAGTTRGPARNVPRATTGALARPGAARGGAVGGGPLAGSALSPATWSQALDVLREKTTRR